MEEAGTYVLVFDNSFSKLTPKKVTFSAEVRNETDVEEKPELTGWMLKKKKQAGIKRGKRANLVFLFLSSFISIFFYFLFFFFLLLFS